MAAVAVAPRVRQGVPLFAQPVQRAKQRVQVRASPRGAVIRHCGRCLPARVWTKLSCVLDLAPAPHSAPLAVRRLLSHVGYTGAVPHMAQKSAGLWLPSPAAC